MITTFAQCKMNQKRGRDEMLSCCWRWRRQWSLFPSLSVCLSLVVLSLVFSVRLSGCSPSSFSFVLCSLSVLWSLGPLLLPSMCVVYLVAFRLCSSPLYFFFCSFLCSLYLAPLFSGFFPLRPPLSWPFSENAMPSCLGNGMHRGAAGRRPLICYRFSFQLNRCE